MDWNVSSMDKMPEVGVAPCRLTLKVICLHEGFEDRSIAIVSLKTLSCAGDEQPAEAVGPKPCVQDCPASQSSPSDVRSFGVSPHAPLLDPFVLGSGGRSPEA